MHAVSVEALLRGLVPSEMPASSHLEALKAQAVTARSNVLAQVGTRHLTDPFVLCAEVHCQAYRGDAAAHRAHGRGGPRDRAARRCSGGRDRTLVDGVYSAVCGGHGEHNDLVWASCGEPEPARPAGPPARVGVALGGRALGRGAPARVPLRRRRRVLSPPGRRAEGSLPLGAAARARRRSPGTSPRSSSARSGRSTSSPGASPAARARSASWGSGASRRSRASSASGGSSGTSPRAMFLVERDGGDVVLRGGGWGHGAGMCQWGAVGRAEAGQGYREILRAYFSGAEVATNLLTASDRGVVVAGPGTAEIERPAPLGLAEREHRHDGGRDGEGADEPLHERDAPQEERVAAALRGRSAARLPRSPQHEATSDEEEHGAEDDPVAGEAHTRGMPRRTRLREGTRLLARSPVRRRFRAGAVVTWSFQFLSGGNHVAANGTWMDHDCNVLVIEDDDDAREALCEFLATAGYRVASRCAAAPRGWRRSRGSVDAVLLDLVIPEPDGFEVLRRIREQRPTRAGHRPVRPLRGGGRRACDEARRDRLPSEAVRRVRAEPRPPPRARRPRRARPRRRRRAPRDRAGRSPESDAPAGDAALAADGAGLGARRPVADTDVPVLLIGESGVGKDVVARRIHATSHRAGRPFVKINCAALPGELLESELFGHEKGAFTGAHAEKPGKFELAHQGTIFLDEIGEMDPRLQAKLLQVLQDEEFYRVGGKRSRPGRRARRRRDEPQPRGGDPRRARSARTSTTG